MRARGLLRLIVPVAVAALAVACFGEDDNSAPTPGAAASGTASGASATPAEAAAPEPTATLPPPPTPLPVSVTGPVPKTVWLIDAASGGTNTLIESHGDSSVFAYFNEAGDGVVVTEAGADIEYELDGSRIGPVFQPQSCQFKADGEQIDGQWHPTFQCESRVEPGHPFLSPTGEWFTYQVEAGSPSTTPVFPPVWELWALNLQTSERRLLQAGLQDCGGCDSRFGPDWSPSGRYYFFSETGGVGRVFLHDFSGNTTRVIAEGNDLQDSPDWAPDEDVLLYRSPEGTTVAEDLAAGEVEVLENLAWPARFDPTGESIYAPAFGPPPSQEASAATRFVVSSAYDVSSLLVGAPEYIGLFRDIDQVIGSPDLVAALTRVPGCDGVTLYFDGIDVTCIVGGQGAALSPDGSMMAVSRLTGVTGQVSYPGGSALNLNVFEVVLVDAETGMERVVADRAVSGEAPLITWNAGSSHVLVIWPYAGGL